MNTPEGEAVDEYRKVYSVASKEGAILEAFNGSLESALRLIELAGPVANPEWRQRFISWQVMAIRAMVDAYTEVERGTSFRAQMDCLTFDATAVAALREHAPESFGALKS